MTLVDGATLNLQSQSPSVKSIGDNSIGFCDHHASIVIHAYPPHLTELMAQITYPVFGTVLTLLCFSIFRHLVLLRRQLPLMKPVIS